MKPDPLVSVVLPVRNGADYIAACLDSLQNQTLTDFEVIVVENGSTDSAPAIIADVVNCDPRFFMVRIGAAGLVYIYFHFITRGGSLNLNIINFIFFGNI